MRKASLNVQIVLWAVVLAMSVSAKPQEQKGGDCPPGSSPASEAEKKPRLVDATRVSTTEVAKSVAQTEASKSVAAKAGEEAGGAAVLEFNPTARVESGAVTVREDSARKSTFKKIHGNVYGATGAGSRETGGAVGTTSKSGKTSVYIGTDRSRTSPPR
jgi:hypothetical protein